MKAKWIIIIYILLSFGLIESKIIAQPINSINAKLIAKNFYWSKNKNSMKYKEINPLLIKTGIYNNTKTYYIFIVNNQTGFVIISADNSVEPILGYSFESEFNTNHIPPALEEMLFDFSKEIYHIISSNIKSSKEILKKWEDLKKNNIPKSIKSIEPLLTTNWGQGCYYNDSCPPEPEGPCDKALVGCTATAMAQVLKYHNFPIKGVGSHSYYHPSYGTLTAHFGNTYYDWANMPDIINNNSQSQEILAVAQLNYHCGVSVNMDYGPNASGASCKSNNLITYYNYSINSSDKYRCNFTTAQWVSLLQNELDNSRPMYYVGYNDNIGHAFVCDGYQDDQLFHFNWGWNGYANGYFSIDDLNPGSTNYNQDQRAIIGVEPGYPISDFSADTIKVFPNQIINFTNLSNGAVLTCEWEFGDGTNSTLLNPTHSYSNYGSYDISLVTYNGVHYDTLTLGIFRK